MPTMAPDAASDDRVPSGTDPRLIEAALACVARWGLSKTTLDDVARQAGCSRATVYRAFPGGKDALFLAVSAAEIARLDTAVRRSVGAAENLEDAIVAALTTSARALADHGAFQYLIAHEPGVVLPHLAFHELDALLGVVASRTGPSFVRFLGSIDEAERLVEWVARIVISHTCSPSTGLHLADDASVRRLVRAFVLPGLLVPT